MSMALLCLKLLSETASPLDMIAIGHSRMCYPTVAVEISFSVEHVLTCKTGGFSAVRHNEVRDITATLLAEVCHGVTIEPHLQPFSGESLLYHSAITEDGARLDIAMYGFGGGGFEKAFVDVRVFNPSTQSNCHRSLQSMYCKHEQEKRRQYDQQVREVEHASFTPP